jgi:type IX secretion system PorP/SprF family membrane protein
MKRRLLVITALSLVVTGNVLAQQDKLITHFIYDKMSVNPGATGFDKDICATLLYRNQWDKVNGAPNSAVFNVEANMSRWFPGGLGLAFYHDAIGFNRQNNLLLNYSYPLEIGTAGTLGIGIGIGMINFGQNPTWVPPTTQTDLTLPVGFNATNLDLNFGLYFRGNADWYAGISSTHLNESLLRKKISLIDYQYQTTRHYYIMGGKTFRNIGNGDIDLQALIRTEFTKFSADINARYIWNNLLYGGITYRTIDAVGIMVGWYPIPNLTVGYSYDITTNKLAGISRGSHEIALRYCYKLPPVPVQTSRHPRWL